MSRRRTLGAILALAALLSLAALTHAPLATAPPTEPTFVRGVALGLFASDPEWDYGSLVDEIRARGASDVLLAVPLYQRDRFASNLGLLEGRSPSHATLARTLQQVREAEMRAAVMPIVRLQRRRPEEWRGVLTPAAGPGHWFASYRAALRPLLEIAEAEGAARFVVGSELVSLEAYQARWRALIADARGRFSGRLSYSANWDHFDSVPFWDALDEVGVTGYFPLQQGADEPSPQSLRRAWRGPRAALEALRTRVGRPVLLTEVGYPSQRGAAREPWNDAAGGEVDLALQAELLESFCQAFHRAASVDGFYVWNWFGFGGPRDDGYSPRGKPAASVLGECMQLPWHKPEQRRSGA